MRAADIIMRKRDGGALSREEIAWFLRGYLAGGVADYQASALLMAIFLRGMDFAETAALADEMMRSGETHDLSGLGRTVDKHSTGGVGDKVSLILAPLAAACGVVVPMVSGRGLGHTGGTLDKLESIPGFRTGLSREEYLRQLGRIGVAMIGQSDSFVPADKRLYALRDVTATVESVPLICASILSKKVASGAHALVMDVKVGTGAFMPTMARARELADGLRGVGAAMGRPVRVLITDMNQPLGRAVGNAIEVREAIECLRGGGPADLREITLEQAAEMILLAREWSDSRRDEALGAARKALDGGAALAKFRDLVAAQGGSLAAVDDPAGLEVSAETVDLPSPRGGFLAGMDCRAVGVASVILGAGRERTEDAVDHAVGIVMLARIGDRVEMGQPFLRIHHRGGRGLDAALKRLRPAFELSESPVSPPPLVRERLA